MIQYPLRLAEALQMAKPEYSVAARMLVAKSLRCGSDFMLFVYCHTEHLRPLDRASTVTSALRIMPIHAC